jgi:hypothetical protein
LITRLGEVIGADGALIERHRQSSAALAPDMILFTEPDAERGGFARYYELILRPQNLGHGTRPAAVQSGSDSFTPGR